MENSEVKVYKPGQAQYWLQPDNLDKIREWSRSGFIIEQLAKNMGIAPSTFYLWRDKYPEINDAWAEGKIAADLQIVNAMFKSASGYKAEEKVYIRDEAGNMVLDKIIEKEVPGNVSAQSLWIKNRMPGFMKDNQLTETYRKKVEAETELIRAKIALLSGEEGGENAAFKALLGLLTESKDNK